LLNLLFLSNIHIIAAWRRDTWTILQPIWISIRICDWRHDRPVGLIEFRCMKSLALQLGTCGRLVVFWPLDARNQFRALKSKVHVDVRPTSTGSNGPSQWKIWTTYCGLWRTPLSVNGDEITYRWSMCSFLLASRSWWQPTSSSSSSSSSSAAFILDLLYLNLKMFKL